MHFLLPTKLEDTFKQRFQKTDEYSWMMLDFRTLLSTQISLPDVCMNMCMQLIYSESFVTMTKAWKSNTKGT